MNDDVNDPLAAARAQAATRALANDVANAQADAARRGFIRWIVLQTIDLWRPAPATLHSLVRVVQGEFADATELELRRHLDYLEERDLIAVHTDPLGQVRAELKRFGIDVVEYTVDVDAGIARPPKG